MLSIWTSVSEYQYSLEAEFIVNSPAEIHSMIPMGEILDLS